VRLNHPETVAVLSCWVIEQARDGLGLGKLMETGRHVLTAAQVLLDVTLLLRDIQVEATFADGRKLVTIHDPIAHQPHEGSGALRLWTGCSRSMLTGRPTSVGLS
jgi:urease gamma subunit